MSLLQKTGIQHLALELVQEIVHLATIETHNGVHNKRSLSDLRLVSRQFKFAVDPFLFTEVIFDFFKYGFHMAFSYLEALAKSTHPACRYAASLRIESLPKAKKTPNSASLGSLIQNAIKSLKNVRVVHWSFGGPDYVSSIVDALSELPRLEDFHFLVDVPSECQVPDMIPLRRFKHLQSVDISGRHLPVIWSTDFANQLRVIFHNGGSLTKLGLTVPPCHGLPDSDVQHVLHRIVRDMPPETHLGLQHLRLDCYSLRIDSITVPHLRNLTFLDVSRTVSSVYPGAQKFWMDLASASIFVKNLIVEDVSPDLLDYLRSYVGLEHLTIVGKRAQRHVRKKELSLELYGSVLPLHKDSLLSFKAMSPFYRRTPSYMIYNNMVSLSACTKLSTLVFTLHPFEIEDVTRSDVKDIVERVLQLPQISSVHLSYLQHEELRRSGSTPIDNRHTLRMTSILTSIDSLNNVVGRQGDFCEISFLNTRYIAYVADGNIKVRLEA